jgi:two-component system CitB family sensor kinase
VIGTVSVGILESELRADFIGNLAWLIGAMLAAALIGLLGAAWVTSVIRARIHRLEPEQITALVKSHETTMHRLSEGVLVVDEDGVITLVNDAGADLIGRDADALTGASAAEALPPELVQILDEGEPSGRPVILGPRVVVARSTGSTVEGARAEATLLLRDHTELHDVVRRVDAADAIIAFRQRAGVPKGLSTETLDRVVRALAVRTDASATEVADALSMSRVSARRYLEYLASAGRASRSLDYRTKGRPGSRYRLIDAPSPG